MSIEYFMLMLAFCIVISQLILELDAYIEELKKTGGGIKEFVNPK